MNRTVRRLTLALLLLSLLLVSLAACGGSSSAYVFKNASGVEIAIGATADTTIDRLGDYISCNESASCGGIEGMDRVYTYLGYRVSTTPSEKGDVICKIELTDDSLSTPEGLTVGMTVEAAKEAMSGKGTAETVGENLVYAAEGMKLQVVCRGGYVIGILYTTA